MNIMFTSIRMKITACMWSGTGAVRNSKLEN